MARQHWPGPRWAIGRRMRISCNIGGETMDASQGQQKIDGDDLARAALASLSQAIHDIYAARDRLSDAGQELYWLRQEAASRAVDEIARNLFDVAEQVTKLRSAIK